MPQVDPSFDFRVTVADANSFQLKNYSKCAKERESKSTTERELIEKFHCRDATSFQRGWRFFTDISNVQKKIGRQMINENGQAIGHLSHVVEHTDNFFSSSGNKSMHIMQKRSKI